METLQSISALSIVLLLAMSGNTTPLSIDQGSLDLEHMKKLTTFKGVPDISTNDCSFFCGLNGKDKNDMSGNYQKIFYKHLYIPNGLSGGCVGSFTESGQNGDDKINLYNKKGVFNFIFRPFRRNLLIHGFHRQFCGENVSASVPEPGLIGLLLSGIIGVFATFVIRKKRVL